jgi:nonsense-mediated mRNA decay protein 3
MKRSNYFTSDRQSGSMLCLKCGQREQFADNLCEECLLGSIEPISIPAVIQGTVCGSCNRLQKGKSWMEIEGSIDDAAVHLANLNVEISKDVQNPSVELSIDHEDQNLFKISGKSSSIYKGVIIHQDLKTEVRLHLHTCPYCSRQMSNYFEAIIQLRGIDNLTEQQLEDLLQKIRDDTGSASIKDPNVFISKEEKVRGGYDFYMGENSFARQLAQRLHDRFGGEMKWSSSLFGRKLGREIYRHTYLVRLPGFLVGDYLVSDKDRFLVKKVYKRVQVRDLKTQRETNIDLSDAMSMRPMKAQDVETDAVVIMQTDKEVQVLHPTTMRPVDLIKPEGIIIGEKAKVAFIEDDLFLI